jgi:acyl phosphate:glycerol-3-phosphate acyltransferase
MLDAVFILTAYLIGSLSFAVIVSSLMGLPDPHEYGSGNPGATNVLRTGNRAAALLTLAGDGLKGWFALWLTQRLAWRFDLADMTIALVGLAVFLGHLYPLYFRFRGGKGVATAAGILFAYDWRVGLGTLATWLIIAFFFRYSSLAALIAAAFAPFATVLVLGFNAYALSVLLISGLLIWRHRENIRKLIEGRESRIGGSKTAEVREEASIPPDPSADGP